MAKRGVRLKLPATSANLGPGFDAAGLALSMHLTVEAQVGAVDAIEATGRNADVCGDVQDSLILATYRGVLERAGVKAAPLRLKLHNEIPLGMGCGSSAAALLAGVALAEHFGALGLGDAGIVAEASRLEGHPDNVAACWYGGFTVSAERIRVVKVGPGLKPQAGKEEFRGLKGPAPSVTSSHEVPCFFEEQAADSVERNSGVEFASSQIEVATFEGDPAWQMLLVMQTSSLATKSARALLPDRYVKADAVFNVQRTALLVAAFAQGRLELLKTAMQDRMHQPYREEACPLLPLLLPLMEEPEIAGVALSGAGPSVLVFLGPGTTPLEAETRIRAVVGAGVEVLPLRIGGGVERTTV